MKKVYIAGHAKGSYRTQHLIKLLLDNNYQLFYNHTIAKQSILNQTGAKKALGLPLRLLEETFFAAVKMYFLAISEVVFVPAMCNEKQVELILAKVFKKKIVTDFYISLYDTVVLDNKELKKKSYKAKWLLHNDYNIVSKANITLFLNRTEAERYLNLINIPFNPQKHFIVPLVVDESIKSELPYFKANSGKMNLCWWGNYIPLHGLEKIIGACSILKNRDDIDFHLYLFGTKESNEKSKKYRKMISDLGLETEVTIDNESTFKNGKLGEFLQAHCDLVLGNFGDSEKSKNVLVNKVIDGVAMKAPVLTGESVAIEEFFSEEQIFKCANNKESIAQSIVDISKMKYCEISRIIDNAYEVYREDFSPKAFESRIKNVLSLLEQ